MKRCFTLLISLISILPGYRSFAQTTLSTGRVLGQITSCQGAQSQGQEVQFFTLQGGDLTGDVDILASAGFLVSTSEFTGFAQDIQAVPHRGLVSETIYVRLGPTAPVGAVSGTVTVSAGSLAPQTLTVSGTVLPIPTAAPEPNIIVLNGATIKRLNFGGTGNTYLWTVDNPDIGLAPSGVDSLPAFRAAGNISTPVTATVTVTPAHAGMAYVADQGISFLSIINTLTNAPDTSVSTLGKSPGGESLSPDNSELYVLNATSLTIAVFNTAINKLKRLLYIPTAAPPYYPIYPYQVAINKDNSGVYLLNFGSADIFVLNSLTGALLQRPLVGFLPMEMAFSPSGNLYYVGANANVNQGEVNIFSTATNDQVGTIRVPVYPGAPLSPPPVPYVNMAFSPDSTILYVCNGSQITKVNTVTQSTIGTIQVGDQGQGSALALAVSPDGNWLYAIVGYAGVNVVQVFNTATNSLTASAGIDQGVPSGLCISPDGQYVYVSLTGSNTVAVFSTSLYKIINYIPVGDSPLIEAFSITPGGCYGEPISFTITVNPAPVPTINASPDSLKALTTVYGTPSVSESFTVTGELLRSAVQVIPAKGFQLSLDNVNFSDSVSIDASGTLAPTPVYVRLAATDVVGSYTGYFTCISPGAGNVNVFIASSTVTPAPLTITADNKTKAFGAKNPPLTATYSGLENGDTGASLVYPPALATTALTDSPVGQYPITISQAYSPNYTITFIPGTLTITPDVIIPNTFTPNGDGINDTWDIQLINDYPNCTVKIFNRDGQLVYSSTGYGIPWNGTYKGSPLPDGTYYYVINLNAGVPLLSGFVAIIR